MSVQIRIQDLVQTKLAGRKIDVVGFVDELLAIATEVGEIRCCLPSDETLRFELPACATCEVELDACRGKLRMVCARLGVLCNETGGAEVSPYGGEGVLRAPSLNGCEGHQWTVRFKNTPSEHDFTIMPAKVLKPQIANGAPR